MKKFWQEFKDFAMKGNVVDMAIGVIIGGAFGKIVTSLVNDIIMPLISLLTGSVNLADLSYTLPVATTEPIVLAYGLFLQNIVDFLLIALSIFLAIRTINRFKRKGETPPVEEVVPEPTKEELLLSEIRDILRSKAEA